MIRKIITEKMPESEYSQVIDNIILNINEDVKNCELRVTFDRGGSFDMDLKKVKELIKELKYVEKKLK